MSNLAFKNQSTKCKLLLVLASIGLGSAFLAEIYKSNIKVMLFTAVEEIRILNPHRTYHNSGYDNNQNYQVRVIDEAISLLQAPFHSIAELIRPRYSSIRQMKLQIPYTTMKIINEDRSTAIRQGTLNRARLGRAYLVDSQGKTYDAKVRLKGDLGQHWYSNKRFSLRVYLSKNNKDHPFPYREFSLHKLSARQYPHEYLFAEVLSRLNLPNTTHEVVRVSVNNQDWGFMDLQEHYGDTLLERQRLKPSSILTFGDERKWKESIANQKKSKNTAHWLSHPRLNVRLSGRTSSSRDFSRQKILDYVKEEVLKPDYQEHLFDPHKITVVNSLLGIWGNYHAMSLTNSKFYFNPFTLKLEPLLQDQGPFQRLLVEPSRHIEVITNGFLKPETSISRESEVNLANSIYKILEESLKKYSKPFFRDDPPINVAWSKSNHVKLLSGDFLKNSSNQTTLDVDPYLSRLDCSTINSFGQNSDQSLSIYSRYTKGRLDLLNLDCGRVNVSMIESCNHIYPLQISLSEATNIYEPYQVPVDLDISCNQPPIISFKNPSGKHIHQQVDVIYNHNQRNPISKQIAPSWIINNSNNEFVIKKGTYRVLNPIVLRRPLIIEPGTILLFAKDAYLVVRGDVTVGARNGEDVIFNGLDGSWKGIYFYSDSPTPINVSLFNTKIIGSERTKDSILDLTGSINIYRAIFKSKGLSIVNSSAEDALNVTESDISISNLLIEKSFSDAFDCDYCTGNITESVFKNVGGDGLDFSGSKLDVSRILFSKVKDKAVSIGESSDIIVQIDKVVDAYTAVAVKDASNATVNLAEVQTDGPFVMSYKKKFIYEAPSIVNIYTTKPGSRDLSKYLAQSGSRMTVDGVLIQTRPLDVENLYRSGPMKK